MSPSPLTDEGCRAAFVTAMSCVLLTALAVSYYLWEALDRRRRRREQARADVLLFRRLHLVAPNVAEHDR